MTNFEKLKQMTVEGMARFLSENNNICSEISLDECESHTCYDCTLKWLRSEVRTGVSELKHHNVVSFVKSRHAKTDLDNMCKKLEGIVND